MIATYYKDNYEFAERHHEFRIYNKFKTYKKESKLANNSIDDDNKYEEYENNRDLDEYKINLFHTVFQKYNELNRQNIPIERWIDYAWIKNKI